MTESRDPGAELARIPRGVRDDGGLGWGLEPEYLH